MKARNIYTNRYYACRRQGGVRYPNAARKRVTMEKLVDGALATAITLASIIIVLVLITM